MKVCITKYALTQGIIKDDNAKATAHDNMVQLSKLGYMHGNDWHTTREAAAAKAERVCE